MLKTFIHLVLTQTIFERRKKGSRGGDDHLFLLFSLLSIVCKEDSYSETCARRNAEGGVSLLSGLARRGGSCFLLFLIYCTGAVYILLGRTK
jgi:hypothetical protein